MVACHHSVHNLAVLRYIAAVDAARWGCAVLAVKAEAVERERANRRGVKHHARLGVEGRIEDTRIDNGVLRPVGDGNASAGEVYNLGLLDFNLDTIAAGINSTRAGGCIVHDAAIEIRFVETYGAAGALDQNFAGVLYGQIGGRKQLAGRVEAERSDCDLARVGAPANQDEVTADGCGQCVRGATRFEVQVLGARVVRCVGSTKGLCV